LEERRVQNRWWILFVLFFARLTMAFQFQSIAALSPFLLDDPLLDFADMGLLIGLYLAPGVIVAIPGGAIAARFGDKRIVTLSLILMLIGGSLIAFGDSWTALVAGRVLAGIGGVVINVVMTKMVVDWFAGREISTALGIFINSWPVGIALALLILPGIAAAGGMVAAWLTVLALIGAGLVLFILFYQAPQNAVAVAPTLTMGRLPIWPLVLASAIWALYNTALAMVFGFGPALLNARGLPPTSASSMTSLFMVVLAISLPLGGILADRSGRRDTVIAITLLSYIILIPLVLFVPIVTVPAIFLTVGLLFGLGAGPIMSLPATFLPPQSRAFAMGVFFSIYYAMMMLAPSVAGALAEWTGDPGPAFVLGTVFAATALIALGHFRRHHAAPVQP
jgi:MFS family permease